MAVRRVWSSVILAGCMAGLPGKIVQAQVSVPDTPPPSMKAQEFHDGHFGVSFEVPEGWTLVRKDKQVSTFHLDARSASPRAMMRSVAAIGFNPYPYSTFSGALVYFSVEPHSSDEDCARQATGPVVPVTSAKDTQDTQDIGGMRFAHGHDEHGKICVEARDEVYTAYRKGACYRFDLAMNTFCSISSGAADMTLTELQQMDQRMANILSTVQLDWEKSGPHPVPAPAVPVVPVGPGPEVKSAQLHRPAMSSAPRAASAAADDAPVVRGQ